MAVYKGEKVGTELCNALGISSEGVYRIVIDCQVGAVAKVDIYKYLTGVEGIKTVLEQYELKKRD